MLDVLILFPAAADASDVDPFLKTLLPLLRDAKGLRSLRFSAGDMMSRGGPPRYSRVVELSFDSLADWMAWVLAPERAQGSETFDRLRPEVLYFEAADALADRSP